MMNTLMLSMYMTILLTLNPLMLGGLVILSFLMMMTMLMNFMMSMLVMMIFLVYIGGLMVMFSYFLSLEPNLMMNIWPMTASIVVNMSYFNNKLKNTVPIYTQVKENISYMLSLTNIEILILLTMMLILTLVIVNFLMMNSKTPMRPYYN